MTAPRGAVLYSPALLALAVELADYPFDPHARRIGSARSRSCGSIVDISMNGSDSISDFGLKVAACAVGQAAAAIFARSANGKSAEDCAGAVAEIRDWLGGAGRAPDWPGFEALAAARDFPGRHEAILLPWRAAIDALSKAGHEG